MNNGTGVSSLHINVNLVKYDNEKCKLNLSEKIDLCVRKKSARSKGIIGGRKFYTDTTISYICARAS